MSPANVAEVCKDREGHYHVILGESDYQFLTIMHRYDAQTENVQLAYATLWQFQPNHRVNLSSSEFAQLPAPLKNSIQRCCDFIKNDEDFQTFSKALASSNFRLSHRMLNRAACMYLGVTPLDKATTLNIKVCLTEGCFDSYSLKLPNGQHLIWDDTPSDYALRREDALPMRSCPWTSVNPSFAAYIPCAIWDSMCRAIVSLHTGTTADGSDPEVFM